MAGNAGWLAIGGAVVAWEVVCLCSRGRLPGLGRAASTLARRLPWRIAMVLAWIFAGVHLFARSSLPGH